MRVAGVKISVLLAAAVVVYSWLLLVGLYRSQEAVHSAEERRLISDSGRRAAVISDFIRDWSAAVERVAESTDVQGYFSNRALGMTHRYGLNISLAEIAMHFADMRTSKHANGQYRYRRIVLLDADGSLLLDSSGNDPPPLPAFSSGRAGMLSVDDGSKSILTQVPVRYAGETVGYILALGSLSQLSRYFIEVSGQGAYFELLLSADGTQIAATEQLKLESRDMNSLALLPEGRLMLVSPSEGSALERFIGGVAVAVRSPLPGVSAALVTVVDRNVVYGDRGVSILLLMMALLPPLAIASFRLYKRTRGRMISAIARSQASDRRFSALQIANSTLTEEIHRREAVEVQLRENSAALEAATRELQTKSQVAESANRAKSDFLANMSHEIRTPLSSMIGMAELLLTPDLAEAERLQYARTVHDCGHALLQILNDILDMSKIEAGKLELACDAFDATELLARMEALFSRLALEKGLALDVRWAGGEHRRFIGDVLRIGQILANLVSNAIKFTQQGRVCITGSSSVEAGHSPVLVLDVSDSGIGIPEERQAELFQPFVQVDTSSTRRFGGTGLGLTIVRRLVRMMSGTVELRSRPGSGTRVEVRLPLQAASEGSSSQASVSRAAASTAASRAPERGGIRVLVVEDTPASRLVAEAMLRQCGADVRTVENGRDAVDLIQAGSNFEIIFMDCQMPVLDGFEATRAIRRWEAEHHLRRQTIVALSAATFENDRKQALESGMDDFLAKPIGIANLCAVLELWGKRSA